MVKCRYSRCADVIGVLLSAKRTTANKRVKAASMETSPPDECAKVNGYAR